MQAFTCRAILFDLDGVLVDSTACIERHWTRWAQHYGLDPAVVISKAHGRPAVETIRELAPHLPAEEETERLERDEALDTNGVCAFPGAVELLQSLPAGAWAVVTSGTRAMASARLQQTGLPTPRVFVTASEIRNGKPHPEPYLLGAEGLGIPAAECLVLEDAPSGIASGKAAGARVIAVTTSHRLEELGQADAIVATVQSLDVSVSACGGKLTVKLRQSQGEQSSTES